MLSSTDIKDLLTTEDIIKLCCFLQEDNRVDYDDDGHPIFCTVLDHHDGDSWKLYYYPETKLFHCYTGDGESYDIFELVARFKKIEFIDAFKFVVNYFKLSTKEAFTDEVKLTDDWDIFQQIDDYNNSNVVEDNTISSIQENLLEYFYPLAAPEEWIKEGIAPDVMRYYGIRIDSANQKIIIPHRDVDGRLLGIRGRSYDPFDLANGRKYMPVYIEGDGYKHPLGKNLYGLYQNKETIKRLKKVCIFEAEKSVLQVASMYGIDNNFAVATCGSALSQTQINLLLDLGVNEIILAFDADHLGDRYAEDTLEYEEKLLNIVEPYLPYVNVSIIFDYDHILPHKASPSDCGKEKFETLYHQKIKIVPVPTNNKSKRGK